MFQPAQPYLLQQPRMETAIHQSGSFPILVPQPNLKGSRCCVVIKRLEGRKLMWMHLHLSHFLKVLIFLLFLYISRISNMSVMFVPFPPILFSTPPMPPTPFKDHELLIIVIMHIRTCTYAHTEMQSAKST